MKVIEKQPPRKYRVGLKQQVEISDCGEIFLAENEQITFINPDERHYDFCAKEWGYYATPSVNGRLKDEGFKTALVRNSQGRVYVMVVDSKRLNEFQQYLDTERNEVIQWLDEL
ncbi:MAG: hypothetical protein IT291_08585 [Deltaproteobacteria bacterium]|nr:hypothetical protein [Deltaproteobacteria bacterium]